MRPTLTTICLAFLGAVLCAVPGAEALAAGGWSGGASPVRPPLRPPVRGDAEMPGELLVKLKTSDALAPLLTRHTLTLVSRFGARPIYRLKVTGNARPRDVAAALLLEPTVLIAETNSLHSSPEARYNVPWAIGNPTAFATQWAPQAMRLKPAQALATGAGVRVAVLDTGIALNHPLLAGRLLPGRDFVDGDDDPGEVGNAVNNVAYGHGTHVAGLVALVAPDAQIVPLRVLDADGSGNAWVLGEALLYAVDPDGNPATDDGAHVVNLSLGSLTRTRVMAAIANLASCGVAIPDDPVADASDPGYNDDRLRCAAGNGAVIVAAAGNDASDQVKEYPAAEGAYGLLSVTASTEARRLAGFSNFGSWVQVAAPGEGVTSTVPGGYGTWSGTSMAAPLAAGTAALVRSTDLGLAPKDVVRRVERSGARLCGNNLHQVDALAAVTNGTAPAFNCQ